MLSLHFRQKGYVLLRFRIGCIIAIPKGLGFSARSDADVRAMVAD